MRPGAARQAGTPAAGTLSGPAELVRRHDPDRFLTALFAPPERREALFVLYAFNHELARAREVVSEPALALIRLQWWREVVEGATRRHDVATPLAAGLAAGLFPRDDLLDMIVAREMEADPAIPTLDAWRGYVLGSAGALAAAAGTLLGAGPSAGEKLRALGAAYGVAGVLRSNRVRAQQGRCLLPEDILARHGLTIAAAIAAADGAALRPVLAELRREGQALLRQGAHPALPRQALAAALPAVLARRDLRRDLGARPRGIGDRLAVMAAGLLGFV